MHPRGGGGGPPPPSRTSLSLRPRALSIPLESTPGVPSVASSRLGVHSARSTSSAQTSASSPSFTESSRGATTTSTAVSGSTGLGYSQRMDLSRSRNQLAMGARSTTASSSHLLASAAGEEVPYHLSAAGGHTRNDQYMSEWDRAYQELYGEEVLKKEGEPPRPLLSVAPAHALAKFTERRPRENSGGGRSVGGGGGGGGGEGGVRGGGGESSVGYDRGGAPLGLEEHEGAIVRGTFIPPSLPFLGPQWRKGPRDPAGTLVDLSERPLMGMALDPRSCAIRAEAAICGSDHAGYIVDLLKGVRRRVLHGGRYGHREWVTGITYMGDKSDRVATCGMDGKVCLWEVPGGSGGSGATRCGDLLGHFGSVSTVASPGGGTPAGGPVTARGGHLLISTGYDKSVRVWDTRSGRTGGTTELKGHGAPVLCSALNFSDVSSSALCATGDRGGVVRLWDVGAVGASSTPPCLSQLSGHGGHITSLAWLCGGVGGGSGDLLVSGAQDGIVRVWDPRESPTACVAKVAAHVGEGEGGRKGSGAVGDIAVARCGGGSGGSALGAAVSQHMEGGLAEGLGEPLLVTAGADRRACVIDPRAGWSVRSVLGGHKDFIYSLTCIGGVALSGCGDGVMLAHSVATGEILWGLGANEAAVRCIGAVATGSKSRQLLVAAGDDGKAIVYDF